jgi:protein-S-isoprenylcysteine O-methyltransferase Ste14
MKTNPPPDHPNVIGFPPVLALSSAAISGGLAYFFSWPIGQNIVARPIGVVLALAAGALAISAARTMRAGGTNINPSEPALAIVRGGPFRLTRNPMYLALCLLHASLGFFLNNWLPVATTAALWAVLHFGVVLREERYLEAKFGGSYLDLKRNVRRWI